MLKQKKCDASLLQQQRLFRLLPHIRFIFVLKTLNRTYYSSCFHLSSLLATQTLPSLLYLCKELYPALIYKRAKNKARKAWNSGLQTDQEASSSELYPSSYLVNV